MTKRKKQPPKPPCVWVVEFHSGGSRSVSCLITPFAFIDRESALKAVRESGKPTDVYRVAKYQRVQP